MTAPARAAERPYYQGKTVTFFINFSAGGPTDIEGRIVARHLARHVPGNPTIVVQNMSGGGGVTGINFLGERAKQDGRWGQAYDSPSRATVPDDLVAAMAKNARASAFFATLDSRNRYAILHRVQTAKKPETRARRIAEFVQMMARREKLYP